jgi:hypothetical protein
MVISPISNRLQGVIHGKEAASKIPREELWCHQVSLEKPEGDLRRPDGAGPEGHDTPHTIRGSRPRKKADRPAFGEDTTQATSVGQETSQSESARDGLHQPEYAYLARMVGLGFDQRAEEVESRMYTAILLSVRPLPAGG